MYTHAPENYSCPFCALINKDPTRKLLSSQADFIYKDEFVSAMITAHQTQKNPGNTIIIPNQHFENVYDVPVVYMSKAYELAKPVALAMKTVFSCDGVSLRQHNEPAGNQDVWHFHIHVTPRYLDDDFYQTYKLLAYIMPEDERAKLADQLKQELKNWKPEAVGFPNPS